LARYQDNLSEWSNISTDCWFSLNTLFSSTNKSDHHGIPWYNWDYWKWH
jgi:hypothetical protein